jgi:hypothetical protein
MGATARDSGLCDVVPQCGAQAATPTWLCVPDGSQQSCFATLRTTVRVAGSPPLVVAVAVPEDLVWPVRLLEARDLGSRERELRRSERVLEM